MKGYKIPEKLVKEIDELAVIINRRLNNEIDPIQFRAKRVAFGIYEQRINDTYMIRVRCPAGLITPSHMKVIANIAAKYGSGRIHITTRQEIQIHNVTDIAKIPEILISLYNIGLSTRGGGGNTVRNIVAPADSGINSDEVFDISPYAIALTSLLIGFDNSWNLPRKFKVNFSYNEKDTGLSRIADLGFIATRENGKDGFIVYAGGGLGVKSAVGHKIFDFIHTYEVGNVAEALKRMFFDHGNRKNRHQARLRFLRDKIGIQKFNDLFFKYYEDVKKENLTLDLVPIENKSENLNLKPESILEYEKRDFQKWKDRFTFKQKQENLFAVRIPLLLGDIDAETFYKLGEFLSDFGENVIRFTTYQDILLRNIHKDYLVNVYNFCKKHFKDLTYYITHLTVCAGADTCKLGLCLSRELAKIILEKIEQFKDIIPDDRFPRIHISGCPNSCGQHWVGDIGFYGFVARKEEKLYPSYYFLAGYENSLSSFKLAEKITEINARDLPTFLTKVLSTYSDSIPYYKNFKYFVSKNKDKISDLSNRFETPSFKVDKNYYYDWGSDAIFSLAERSTGECSAGFFDFIERDLAKIEEYKQHLFQAQNEDEIIASLQKLLYFSSRMLLITRGIEAEKEVDVYKYFIENFIDTGYISSSFRELFDIVENKSQLIEKKEKIISLSENVIKLYDSMDTNFQFYLEDIINIENKPIKKSEEKVEQDKVTKLTHNIKRFKDLRGVACPMNFVKAKLELSFINSGDLLEIYLDEGEPIENVPGSLKGEGHKIVSIKKRGDYYSLIVEKA